MIECGDVTEDPMKTPEFPFTCYKCDIGSHKKFCTGLYQKCGNGRSKAASNVK